jgi:hypothetical protein
VDRDGDEGVRGAGTVADHGALDARREPIARTSERHDRVDAGERRRPEKLERVPRRAKERGNGNVLKRRRAGPSQVDVTPPAQNVVA